DCRSFYRTYYAPNNATVVLVGDFDEERALALIEKHYGPIPSAPIPLDETPPEPEQREERRAKHKKPVTADKLRVGYKGPALGDADYQALEVASEILFGGNSSRLQKLLVADTEIASSVGASIAPFRDPGLYEISVGLQRNHRAEAAERMIYEELSRLGAEPLKAGELDTARTRLETRLWRELRPQSGKAEALGHYQTTVGDYRKLFGVADGYRRVNEDDVRAAAAKYLRAERRTVVIAVADEKRA
ncbi:MAG TPA: insulinase family protein, partial [Polyangia bacterium]|nr:insulinase family protein [Polyangia bacterium]